MIHLETDLEGKEMTFGQAKQLMTSFDFHLGGSWDYDHGVFDGVLHKESGETIYLRLPFQVISGELDHKNASIQFEKAYVIKHVVNLGLDRSDQSLLTTTGLSQFQKPLDPDGYIRDKSKWEEFGEEIVLDLLDHL